MDKPPGALRIYTILTFGVIAMSMASILIRWALDAHIPPLVIASYRLTVGTLAVGGVTVSTGTWQQFKTLKRADLLLVILSGILLGFHFALWISSLSVTTVMISVVLVTTTPLWAGIMSHWFVNEKVSRLTWIGMFAAILGAGLIGLGGAQLTRHLDLYGGMLAFGGSVMAAGYLVIGRHLRSRIPLSAYLTAVYGMAALTLICMSVVQRAPLFGYSFSNLLLMIAIGVVPQVIGHSAANYAVRHLPATYVGIVTLGEPVGSSILAIWLLGEIPTILQSVGALTIMIGIIIATIRNPSATG